MVPLTKDDVGDLRSLSNLCKQMNADLVIVGAVAYQIFFPNKERFTSDFDFAIALDLDAFATLGSELERSGWAPVRGREHRWRSPHGAWFDLLPAGKALRAMKQIIWPESGFTMSLIGFDHVFSDAEPVNLAQDLTFLVIPPTVLTLLKIVAFMDRPPERQKDLDDIRDLLAEYEAGSDRIFSEAFGDGPILDYSLANAFLLGRDLRKLCTDDEIELVHQFIALLSDEANAHWWSFVRASRSGTEEAARLQFDTFSDAFG
ncbi:MAG TPA: hypothetical protein VLZ81_08480 [Blastocatellia bacterium]|nr:hypothetical protein [Blastocatellia bacterium]